MTGRNEQCRRDDSPVTCSLSLSLFSLLVCLALFISLRKLFDFGISRRVQACNLKFQFSRAANPRPAESRTSGGNDVIEEQPLIPPLSTESHHDLAQNKIDPIQIFDRPHTIEYLLWGNDAIQHGTSSIHGTDHHPISAGMYLEHTISGWIVRWHLWHTRPTNLFPNIYGKLRSISTGIDCLRSNMISTRSRKSQLVVIETILSPFCVAIM